MDTTSPFVGILNPDYVVRKGYVTNFVPDLIQPNSIDLTVKSVYVISGPLILFADKETKRQLPEYNLIKPFAYEGREMYLLEPGIRYQVELNELLSFDTSICGITLVRSTMAKSGCSGENGLFDSGYHGACGMMVSVQATSYIEVGCSIAQMIFFSTNSSKMYNGFYQGSQGPLEWN